MNWGTKLVIGIAMFMAFIVGMVVYMFKVHGEDGLVEDDYYEKGINYDAEYDAKTNVLDDGATPEVKISDSQIIVQLKDAADYQLQMMRPSSSKKDIHSSGKTLGAANLIVINTQQMDKGLWSLKLSWQVQGKRYMYQKDIML
jgi:hypothetical protein